MFSPSYAVAQHKVSIALPSYFTFFYTAIPGLPTGITYLEPLNSYHLGSVQHFNAQASPSAPLLVKQQACSTCASCCSRELLLCSVCASVPSSASPIPADTELRRAGFLTSPPVLCYGQFLVAFNLFLSSCKFILS